MRKLISRLVIGALLVVVAGFVLGFESEGGGHAPPAHYSWNQAHALLARAGIQHIRGVRSASQRQLQTLPYTLRRCPGWLFGSSATGGHVNAWVCRSHADALAALVFIVKGAQLGGPNLESSTNRNLVLVVLARNTAAAAGLTTTLGGG